MRNYKKRNLQLAARWLADFAAGPTGILLVGVSTDSEVLINTHPGYDYNPIVLEEFVALARVGRRLRPGQRRSLGRPGPGPRHPGAQQRWGTSYARWRDVKPPREPSDSAAWKDWLRFRALLVEHNVQEQVDWIREAGLTSVPVFPTRRPALDPT